MFFVRQTPFAFPMLGVTMLTAVALAAEAKPGTSPAWADAHQKGPMSAEETRDFMKRLLGYVEAHHLKKSEASAQRGMVYEYVNTRRRGQYDQWIQGEALDTMHDGAWLAAAMVNAFRATADPAYKNFLTKWQLPFYLKMLNHSDELFSASRNDAAPDAHVFPKTHQLIEGEKGFVPYWWDDGASVSLDRREKKQALGAFACRDNLAGKPNPQYLLNGYSLGMSNHMAQDLGAMLQLAWLLTKDGTDDADRCLAAELAQAARNLHDSRMRHHGPIPMCVAPAALSSGDAELMKKVPADGDDWTPRNQYVAALYETAPGQERAMPAFADDQQYRYYYSLARHGGRLPPAVAFRVVYDAYTEPMLWRLFSDDEVVPPGINRGEFGMDVVGGRFEYYRSDSKGTRFLGSRMGPQSMVMAGIALQLLRACPGLWDERHRREFADDALVPIMDPPPGQDADIMPRRLVLGQVTLDVVSKRLALVVTGEYPGNTLVIKVFSRPDSKGTHAVVTLRNGEPAAAVNDAGETLIVKGQAVAADAGMRFRFELPYTVSRGQEFWANGIEHGRYTIRINDAAKNIYLASPEHVVKAWLERELGQGLRTWDAIFRHYGYIPTHIGRNAFWDGLSDSGGYAHLISAGAEWLMCLEGKNDWEVHRVPAVPSHGKAGG